MAIAAVDFGGTLTKIGLVEGGRVVARKVLESEAPGGLTSLLPAIEASIRGLLTEAAVPASRLAGVGMGLPCLVDPVRGTVLSAPKAKFDDAMGLDLPEWGRERFGVRLGLENDAHAALLGEWGYGAGREVSDLVCVTLGTGIGTSVMIQGRLLRGRHFQAGVLGGHFPVVPGGRPCPCGGAGCFETECGSWALPALAKSDARYAASALSREPRLDYSAVFKCASDGDALAASMRDRALGWWACVIVTLIHAYDPERVVVGGGIMASASVILPHLRKAVESAWTPWGRVAVTGSDLGSDAALLGLAVMMERPLEYL